jgi:hypothetical protein
LPTTAAATAANTTAAVNSPQVGLKFGTDGDFFAVGYNGVEEWAGIGYGADVDGHHAAEGDTGPCITSVCDMRDPAAPVREGCIIEVQPVKPLIT